MNSNKLGLSFAIIALLACGFCLALAQEQAPSISQLQQQIQKMESLDADPETPQDIRSLNRVFLNTRRAQLRNLLTKNISALRKYQSGVKTVLSTDENRTLEATIADWEKTLQELNAKLDGAPTQIMGSDGSPPTSAASGTTEQPLNTNVPSRVPAPVPSRAAFAPLAVSGPTCYPNPPPKVQELADAVASLIVDLKQLPTDAIGVHLEKLLYFTVADALLEEKEKINLRKLHVQQFVAETARTDKQTNAPANVAGAVSAAEKPGFSQLLGFAIDHGAIEKQVNGTSLTLSSSPYALLAAANGGDTSENHERYDFFNRIGISANFNIANQTDPLSSARRKQLSEWGIKVRLNKDYSSRSKVFQDFWDADIKPLIEQRAVIYVSAFDTAFNNELKGLYKTLKDEFSPLSPAKSPLDVYLESNSTLTAAAKKTGLSQEIICRLKAEVYDAVKSGKPAVSEALRDDVNRTLKALVSAELSVGEGKKLVDDKIKELNQKPTSTFAYSNQYPAIGSAYSNFKFLHQRKSYDPFRLVANAGFSLYQKPNPKLNQQTMRDLAFALSFDGIAGRSPFVSATSEFDQSKITFSFTGRYQRIFENRHQPKKKADIAVGQFKVEIPIVTGMSLPFSVSFANATELIKEKHVRANFGFSFDTDKLFLLAGMKKP